MSENSGLKYSLKKLLEEDFFVEYYRRMDLVRDYVTDDDGFKGHRIEKQYRDAYQKLFDVGTVLSIERLQNFKSLEKDAKIRKKRKFVNT